MKRRNFLRVLSTGAGVAAFSPRDRALAEEAKKNATAYPADIKWGKAPCRYCGTGCGLQVGVKDGRVVAIKGDEASPVNRGLLCVKGYHAGGLLYGQDRLKYPMLRGKNGRHERVSWEQAIDRIAREYRSALDSHGPDSVAMYGSGQWTVFDGYAATKWLRAGMRSNNLEPNARLCMASAVMGFMTQFQSDEPMGCYEDFEAGDDFVMWGNNMAEMHPVLFSRILQTKRRTAGCPHHRHRDPAHAHQRLRRPLHRDEAGLRSGDRQRYPARDSSRMIGSTKRSCARTSSSSGAVEDIKKIGYGCYGEATPSATASRIKGSGLQLSGAQGVPRADYTPEKVEAISRGPGGTNSGAW